MIEVKTVSVYKTSDGTLFEDALDAQYHEAQSRLEALLDDLLQGDWDAASRVVETLKRDETKRSQQLLDGLTELMSCKLAVEARAAEKAAAEKLARLPEPDPLDEPPIDGDDEGESKPEGGPIIPSKPWSDIPF